MPQPDLDDFLEPKIIDYWILPLDYWILPQPGLDELLQSQSIYDTSICYIILLTYK